MLRQTRDGPIKLNFPSHDSMATMALTESHNTQEKIRIIIQTMIAAGIMIDIPPIEISMIELSSVKRTKSSTITVHSIPCSPGKKEE
jgi:hypothetical protein